MKYAVKNCPQFVLMSTVSGKTHATYFDMCGKAKGHIQCKDVSDCVIKQVIEKFKEHPFIDCACGDDILQMFDIEEINK